MVSLEVRSESSRKRFPRVFLASQGESLAPLPDLFVQWSDRFAGPVIDLSDAGLIVAASGIFSQVRPGKHQDVKLRIGGEDVQTLSTKVNSVLNGALFLTLDSLTTTGRLKVDQEARERLVSSSWRRLSTSSLHPSFHLSQWWHAAFDTNLWIWRDSAGVLERVLLEFESVALMFDKDGKKFLKAPASFDEAKGYAGPFTEPMSHKVEPGHNWGERIEKALRASLPLEVTAEVLGLLPKAAGKALHV